MDRREGDTTGRKFAHAEVNARERELRDLIGSIPAIAWTIRADGSEVFASKRWTEYTGLPPEALSGSAWLAVIHPQDVAVHASKWRESVITGVPFENEARLRRADGEYRWYLVRAVPLQGESRQVLKWYGLATDIEERKRAEQALRASEERFRTLVQFSFDVYWETDAQHRFTVQQFGDDVIGGPTAGSEIGKTRWEVPYLAPDEEGWRKHRATLDAHLPFRDFELARPTPEGGVKHVSTSGLPMFDETGRFIGYRGVGHHIADRKHAEAEQRGHVWFFESLDRVNRAIQETDDLDKMTSDVLHASLEMFACDRAWLAHPCDPNASSWHVVMEHTRAEYPRALAMGTECPVEADVATVFAAALAAPGPVVFDAARDLAAAPPEVADRVTVQSQIAMAIDAKSDKPYLFGLQQCSSPRDWSTREQRLLQEIGRRFGDALSSLSMLRRLRESERKLQAAQEIAQLGWWERDFTTNRVSLSKEVQRIFGVQPLDLPQWQDRWVNLIHPGDRAKTAAVAAAAVRGGPRYDVEYRVIRPDGTVRVVHSQGDVTWDDSGAPVRQFGVLQDVTDLRRAEDELRVSEARFRTFVDHARDGFFLMDERMIIVDVNQQACESLGYLREELIGMSPRDFDAALNETSIAQLAERAGGGETLTFETLHRRKEGTTFPVEIRSHHFLQGGKAFYLALVRDISERKRAQEDLRATELRYRTLVDFAADAFMLHDETGRVVDVNRQACENLGYTREELIGMMPADFDADFDSEVLRGIAARVARGETLTIDTHHRRKNGTVFPVEVRLRQVSEHGRHFALSLARDITDRRRGEEERDRLGRLEADLTRMSRIITMGELTASIAHEVNQPLAAMVTNAAACERWLAATRPETEKARSALASIRADGQRASAVIARIRALMQRQPPRKEPVELNEAIREVLALAQTQLGHIDVTLRLADDVASVEADKVQLQQVLINLIVNAIEAMSGVDDRPRELTIVSRRDGDDAVIEVRDSGTGLDPERAERLFEPFHTTKDGGMGIGLAISRSIVEAHGGQMRATTNTPHGAVFLLSLPVRA